MQCFTFNYFLLMKTTKRLLCFFKRMLYVLSYKLFLITSKRGKGMCCKFFLAINKDL